MIKNIILGVALILAIMAVVSCFYYIVSDNESAYKICVACAITAISLAQYAK